MNAANAAWLTRSQAAEIADSARRQALEAVYASQPQWPHDRCAALLDRCTRDWGVGPTMAAHVLVQARGSIRDGFYLASGACAGVLIVRTDGGERITLLTQTAALARRLSVPGSLWVDLRGLDRFNGELTDDG